MPPNPSPFLSVIVVCRNPGASLRQTLDSVWSQDDATAELVIVNGASTDGTAEWLDAQRERVSSLISEPDHGVYDAMNKGLRRARGEWVLFLGADDELVDVGVFGRMKHVLALTTAAVVIGEALYSDGRRYRFGEGASFLARNPIHHQAAFYRRCRLIEREGFDASLRVMGDYDMNLRLYKAGLRLEAVGVVVTRCGVGGISDRGAWTGYREEIVIRHRYFAAWRCWGWDLISFFRFVRKRWVVRFRRNS